MRRRPKLLFLSKSSSKAQKNRHQLFEVLPIELLINVFKYLSPSDILRCSRTCKLWLEASKETDIWHALFRGLPKKIQKISLEAKKPKINVDWKRESVSCSKVSRRRQIDAMLKKKSTYTGLPEKTFTALKYLKVQWSLVFTDARGNCHEIVSKDLHHFSSSVSVSWSDVRLPPVGELHSCNLLALTPLFYDNAGNGNKMSPAYESVCTRSLLTKLPLKGNFYKNMVLLGKDEFVSIFFHPFGIVFGVWHDKSPKKCNIAFVTFYSHAKNIIDIVLCGTYEAPYVCPPHEPEIDDLDGKYGLQRYSAVVEIRTSRKMLWSFQVAEFYKARIEDNTLIMTDERPTYQGCFDIQNSIRLPWKAGSIKGHIKDVAAIDFTLLDGNKDFIWCASQPVLGTSAAESEVDFNDDASEQLEMLVKDSEKGTLALQISLDRESDSCAVRSIEVRLNMSFINQWFGTTY